MEKNWEENVLRIFFKDLQHNHLLWTVSDPLSKMGYTLNILKGK